MCLVLREAREGSQCWNDDETATQPNKRAEEACAKA